MTFHIPLLLSVIMTTAHFLFVPAVLGNCYRKRTSSQTNMKLHVFQVIRRVGYSGIVNIYFFKCYIIIAVALNGTSYLHVANNPREPILKTHTTTHTASLMNHSKHNELWLLSLPCCFHFWGRHFICMLVRVILSRHESNWEHFQIKLSD